jgi:predicted ATPase/DNA-binding XRE family transcriptional regulator
MDETKTFGEWLRHRRRELDLTHEELARQVNCAPITVRKIEADQLRPSKQLAELLLEQLRVAVDERKNLILFARGGELLKSTSATVPADNLPHPISSFIGREREIAEITRLIHRSRLLTLTGAGGCGKTRLAIEIVNQMLDLFPDGAWFVALAPLFDPQLVQRTIASVLGVREDESRPLIETLCACLHSKHLLLVLDNCEHLIGECAQVTDRLLQACPQLRVLATSREALGIEGEEQYYVPCLSLPEVGAENSIERLHQSEAVRLFVNRGALIQSTFSLTSENSDSIVQICRRLDGMPLAIELAAARVKVFTVQHIAEGLDDRFSLLTTGNRMALPRHQTLRAAIEWSYGLLP